MIRPVGIFLGLFFVATVLLWSLVPGVALVLRQGFLVEPSAERAFHAEPREVSFQHDGVFGTWNYAQLQRGYKVYKEVCSACHGLRLVAFRNLAELGYSEGQVKAEAANWQVPGIDPNTGEATMRAAVPTDQFPSPYANNVAAVAANNGKIPPDLSLITKARGDGTNYVYSLLTGYADAAAYTNEHGRSFAEAYPDLLPQPGNYFNPYYSGLNIGMAPPIVVDGQVTYDDGTASTVSQMSQDVAAFLTWTAEPTLVERKQTGWPVLGFLLFATVLAWLAKRQVWSNVKPKHRKGEKA